MRPSSRMAKWFKACFQPVMGIVHFFAASPIASQISFNADSAFGYCLRLRVNLRITLLTDSIALVVEIALRIGPSAGGHGFAGQGRDGSTVEVEIHLGVEHSLQGRLHHRPHEAVEVF